MKSLVRGVIATLTGATALSTGQLAVNAQDAAQAIDTPDVIDMIVVTGRGREESILEVPISQTVFGAEAIEDARIDQVDDFIALTPGITIANSQDAGTNFITIRGMSQTRNGEPPVAVVIDDVLQVNSRTFDQGLFDIRSVEVLRGPQGALYGRNATNGAIIINTRGPSDELEGYIQGSYGKGEEYAIEGSISGPIIEDKLLARVSARYYDREGYLQNITLGQPADNLKEFNFRGHLRFNLTDNLTADLRGSLTRTDGGAINFTYQPVIFDRVTGFPSAFDFTIADADLVERNFFSNNPGRDERNVTQVSLRLNYEFDWGVLRSVTAYDSLDQTVSGDQFPYSAATTVTPAPPFPFFDGTQNQHVDVEAVSQEIRLTSRDDQRFRWMFGGYYLSTDRFISSPTGDDLEMGVLTVRRDPFLGDPTNPTRSWVADDNDNTAWALFFNSAYDVTESLEIAFAGRYDKDKRRQMVDPRQGAYNADGTLAAAIGVPGAINNAEFSRFQPKVSARYLLTDNVSIYASWGRGFRSGQFNQNGVGAVAADAGVEGVGDVLAQENSASYEAGAKARLFDGRVNASGAIFRTRVENAPYFVFIGAISAQVLVGIDEVEIIGGEFEVSANLYDGLDAYVGLGISDSEVKVYSVNPAAVGNEAPYVPKSTFNAGLQYRVPVTRLFGLFGRLDYERRGEQFWDTENTTSRSTINLVNLRAGIEDSDGAWSLIASIDNLTDEIYNSEWVLGGFAHAGLPRVWRIDLRANF